MQYIFPLRRLLFQSHPHTIETHMPACLLGSDEYCELSLRASTSQSVIGSSSSSTTMRIWEPEFTVITN